MRTPLTLWSSGDDAITIERPNVRQQYTDLKFFPPLASEASLPRDEIEGNLFDLVRSVLDRLPQSNDASRLHDAWNRVLESLGDPDGRQYCQAAGRLGIDPYDPDSDDISELAQGLSSHLFANICEAVKPKELQTATVWAREGMRHLDTFPDIAIEHFGAPARRAGEKIHIHGYETARFVRRKLGLDDLNPRRLVDNLFGSAVRAGGHAVAGSHPRALEALATRRNGAMRAAIPATSAKLRRWGLCRAFYLTLKTADDDFSAVTTAATLDQQASRAFAAELLAPAALLEERAGADGLTPEAIETIAEESICPEAAVIWQAHNHGIPLRGVALPKAYDER